MSQFDQDCITYTQEGRILQLEYAAKSVENSQTIIGVKCKDGVLLGAQKLVFSKLLVERTNRRIYNIDKYIGMAIGGKIPDGRHLMNYARNQTNKYFKDYDVKISGRTLSDRLALYLNAYTLYNSVRPFGSAEIIASWNKDQGYGLFMLQPSGNYYAYTCCTSGKGRQSAKAQFQKVNFSNLSCEESLFHMAKILTQTHEESHEKKYQIQMSWICPASKNIHQMVPLELIKQASQRALVAIEEQQMA